MQRRSGHPHNGASLIIFSNDTAEKAALSVTPAFSRAMTRCRSLRAGARCAHVERVGQSRTGPRCAHRSLRAGRDALTQGYGQAGDLYKGLIASYGQGANAYGDASGANGAAGYDRARANFQTNPGYAFQMDQGQQALNRAHAAAGNLSSGNADTDTLKFSQGLGRSVVWQYVSAPCSLSARQQGTAVAGAAGNAAAGGNAQNQSYEAQGGAINSSYGAQGLGLGTGSQPVLSGARRRANSNYTGQGASNAAATMNNYNIGANQLGALTSLAGLAAGGIGGAGGFSSLFSGFGGGGGLASGKAFNNSNSNSNYFGPLN
jgi:hypothetical protein